MLYWKFYIYFFLENIFIYLSIVIIHYIFQHPPTPRDKKVIWAFQANRARLEFLGMSFSSTLVTMSSSSFAIGKWCGRRSGICIMLWLLAEHQPPRRSARSWGCGGRQRLRGLGASAATTRSWRSLLFLCIRVCLSLSPWVCVTVTVSPYSPYSLQGVKNSVCFCYSH